MGKPIGYAQSYVALSGDGWWEEETDRGVRGIDTITGECITTGQRLGTKLVRALVELLNDQQDQTDPSPSFANVDATKAGFEARYRNHPRWSSRVHGSNTPGIRTQCCLTLPSRGTLRPGLAPAWPPLINVKHHEEVIAEIDSTIRGSWRQRHRTDVAGRTFVRLRR